MNFLLEVISNSTGQYTNEIEINPDAITSFFSHTSIFVLGLLIGLGLMYYILHKKTK